MMESPDGKPSKRNLIRQYAVEILASAPYPVHVSRLAELVLPRIPGGAEITQKTVNTSLHDDPLGRFERVGLGTWKLKR